MYARRGLKLCTLLGVSVAAWVVVPQRPVPLSCPPASLAQTPAPEPDIFEADLLVIKEQLNRKHGDFCAQLLLSFTPLGQKARSANFWSGDAFRLVGAEVVDLRLDGMTILASAMERNFLGQQKERYEEHGLDFTKACNWVRPPRRPSEVKRALVRLANLVGREQNTGSIWDIPVDTDRWAIPQTLFLNNVPHNRFARQFFYNAIVKAVNAAIDDPSFTRRMRIRWLIPETNPSFDTFRIGTILELARELVFSAVDRGMRVKLCVQGKLGQGFLQGMPINLNGCRLIMENMDWGEGDDGDEDRRIVGRHLFFGEIGPEVVEEADDIFILVSPTNVIGGSIVPLLEAMVEKAGNRPFILLNPTLADRPSSNNLMQIRGREERTTFVNTFKDVFMFRTEHDKGLFKIVGAWGKAGHDQPYVMYRLSDNQDVVANVNQRKEVYEPLRVHENDPNA